MLTKEKAGKVFVLETLQTQKGDIPVKELSFRNGKWILRTLQCYSSLWLGLGDCRCADHSSKLYSEISKEEAIALLQKLSDSQTKKQKVRLI